MLVTGFPDDDDNLFGGRYRIISRLGAGAYRAWDEQEGRLVVIKIVKKAFLDDPKFTEGFARKIRLLQGLRHPHIVPIVDVDVGEHDGLPFVVIVMRFLPGGSLSNHRLRDDNGKVLPNPPGMLHLWLPDVADALDHVHANGVVHRDVKPANIFFDAYWNAFLGDFGNAKIVEESERFAREKAPTVESMGIGTPDYMAPECFTPKALLDGRTDQYALASMVYEMLAGMRPFTGTTAHIVVEVTSMPVPRLDRAVRGLPSSLVEAVHRGLAKNPQERFPTCREFACAVLENVPLLADEPDVARLLCPKCSNILKLPVAAAGQKGKCPKCQTTMKVADDLGALWLLAEARQAWLREYDDYDYEVNWRTAYSSNVEFSEWREHRRSQQLSCRQSASDKLSIDPPNVQTKPGRVTKSSRLYATYKWIEAAWLGLWIFAIVVGLINGCIVQRVVRGCLPRPKAEASSAHLGKWWAYHDIEGHGGLSRLPD